MNTDLPADPKPSKFWCNYLLANEQKTPGFPWNDSYTLSERERDTIRASIQQFQLGEGSSGKQLLDRGRAYSLEVDDALFLTALGLFVREEQRHSAYLLRFMQQQEIPAISQHWVDVVFRRLRRLAGLELSLRVLVTAEIIAVPYYRALRGATKSQLLASISTRILEDEAGHLRFQSSMLSRFAAGRSALLRALVSRMHRLFLCGTACVVWMGHRAIFRAAGYSFKRFVEESVSEFMALDRRSLVGAEGERISNYSWGAERGFRDSRS
jgi:hypothetical protein